MRFALLDQLFREKYPGGSITYGPRRGRYHVQFAARGKVYTYTSPTVCGLARRFDLVVEEWITSFADRVVVGVGEGQLEFVGPHGAGDTLRYRLPKYRVECKELGRDEMDRVTARYTLVLTPSDYVDPWCSTRR